MSVQQLGNHTSKLYQRAIDNHDKGAQAQTLRQQAKDVEAQKAKVLHAQKYASPQVAAGETGRLHNLEKKFMTTAVAYYDTHQADGGSGNAKLARASLTGLGTSPLHLTETSDKRSLGQQSVDLSKTGLSPTQKKRVSGVLDNKPSRWTNKDWRSLVDAGSNPAANKVIGDTLGKIDPSLKKAFQQDRAAVVQDKSKLNHLPFPRVAGSAGIPENLHPDAVKGLEAARQGNGAWWPSLVAIGINSPDAKNYIANQLARTDDKAAVAYKQDVARFPPGSDLGVYFNQVKPPPSLTPPAYAAPPPAPQHLVTGLPAAQDTRVNGILAREPSGWNVNDWRALVDASRNPTAHPVISDKLKTVNPSSLQDAFEQDSAFIVDDPSRLRELPLPSIIGNAGNSGS